MWQKISVTKLLSQRAGGLARSLNLAAQYTRLMAGLNGCCDAKVCQDDFAHMILLTGTCENDAFSSPVT